MTESFTIRQFGSASSLVMRSIRSPAQATIKLIASLFRREEGGIAIEFAFLAPLLCLALLFLGAQAVRVHRWINVEQILRVGTEVAIRGGNQQEILARMNTVATAKGYTLLEGPVTPGQPLPLDTLSLTAAPGCTCLDTMRLEDLIGCNAICPNGRPAAFRVGLTASYNSSFDIRLSQAVSRLPLLIRFMNVTDLLQTKFVVVR